MSSAGGPPPPAGPSGGSNPLAAAADATHDQNGPTQDLIKLAMDAKKLAESSPETAQFMREIQNQVRMATMKVMQMRQQQAQQTPQI